MRALLAVLALPLVCLAAAGPDVSGSVQQLDTDAAARITVIGEPGDKEARSLGKMRTKLTRYEGTDDVADFRVLASAGKLFAASRTEDAVLLADARAVVEAMLARVQYRHDQLADALAGLVDPVHIAAIEALAAKPDALFDGATAAAQRNPIAALPKIVDAYDMYGWYTARARKLVEKEQGSPPPDGVSVTSLPDLVELVNSGAASHDIKKIRVFATVTSGTDTVKIYTGQSAKALIPGLFSEPLSNRVQPATVDAGGTQPYHFPLTPILQQLIPAGTVNGRISGVLQVTFKGESFFVVSFDVVAP